MSASSCMPWLAALGRVSGGVTVHQCCAESCALATIACKRGVLSAWNITELAFGSRYLELAGANRNPSLVSWAWEKAENPLIHVLNRSLVAGFPVVLLQKWIKQRRNRQGMEFIGWQKGMWKEIEFCRIFLNRWVNSLHKIFWEQL